jgi:hypothetical protein
MDQKGKEFMYLYYFSHFSMLNPITMYSKRIFHAFFLLRTHHCKKPNVTSNSTFCTNSTNLQNKPHLCLKSTKLSMFLALSLGIVGT